jgi:hypothetical protein
MSETSGSFQDFEAEFAEEHDFETLKQKITDALRDLDAVAHQNGTAHSKLETLSKEVLIHGIPFTHEFMLQGPQEIVVRTFDSQGDMKSVYRADMGYPEPEPYVYLRKHAADLPGAPRDEGGEQLTQRQTMIMIASLLESALNEEGELSVRTL